MKKLRNKTPSTTKVESKVRVDPHTPSEIQKMLIKSALSTARIGYILFLIIIFFSIYLLSIEQIQLTQSVDIQVQEFLSLKLSNATPAITTLVLGLVVLFITRFDYSHIEKK
ncbi:hypothetical protein [Shewanella xiamenensis]|uniref:hypothetical protein n=1 Tax=Shewanella xiamenensis TaxID=332186 RepID=UPI000849EAD6|nr:hypothetical protein [Shewanella xiamenensis]ODR85806.1 hypothetical protein ABT47_11095 [Shewanella xiamenensis]